MHPEQKTSADDKFRITLTLFIGSVLGVVAVSIFPMVITAWPLLLVVVAVQFFGETFLRSLARAITRPFKKTEKAPDRPKLQPEHIKAARIALLIGLLLGGAVAFIADWHIEIRDL